MVSIAQFLPVDCRYHNLPKYGRRILSADRFCRFVDFAKSVLTGLKHPRGQVVQSDCPSHQRGQQAHNRLHAIAAQTTSRPARHVANSHRWFRYQWQNALMRQGAGLTYQNRFGWWQCATACWQYFAILASFNRFHHSILSRLSGFKIAVIGWVKRMIERRYFTFKFQFGKIARFSAMLLKLGSVGNRKVSQSGTISRSVIMVAKRLSSAMLSVLCKRFVVACL